MGSQVFEVPLIAMCERLFTLSLIIVFISETVIWMLMDGRLKKILSYFRPWIILNISVIFTCIGLINLLINQIYLSAFIVFLFAELLVGIHVSKFKLLGAPLFFWDYTVLRESLLYLPALLQKRSTYAASAFVAALLGVTFYLLQLFTTNSTPFLIRLTGFSLSFSIVVLCYRFARVPYHRFFPANSYRDSIVFKTGLFSFFVLTARHSKSSPPPENYNRESIEIIREKYKTASHKNALHSQEQLPNIIFYSIESLMDFENLGIELKNPPMPFYSSLAERTGKSYFVSPSFGGQTVQPEFEILTGLSQFQLSVPNPFLHVINNYKHFPALSRGFQDSGYYSLGVQAVTAHEFQRKHYYPIIGFDRFVALESDYPKEDWELMNRLLSDDYLVKKIIENLPHEKQPLFGLFLNNATHASYFHWEKNDEFKILNQGVSDKTRDTLERYASAVNHADQALERLVRHFDNPSQKTIFVIFGDHLPGLSSVFKDLNVFKDDQRRLMFHTPLRIWSNFDLPKQDRTISANLLVPYILDLLKLDLPGLPAHFQLVKELYNRVDVFSAYIQDKQGQIHQRNNPPGFLKELAHEYDLLQYDLLEGGQFSIEEKQWLKGKRKIQ